MFFTFVSPFHKVRSDLKVFRMVFTNEIVIRFVLNKINLTWHITKLIIMLLFVVFLN